MMGNFQSSTWWLLLQIWLAGMASAVVTLVLLPSGEERFGGVFPYIALSGLATVVVSWQLLRTYALVSRSLRHLSDNHQLAFLPPQTYWPFHKLVADINKLGGYRRDVHQLRGDFVEQVREAGAQEERNRLARDLHDSIKQQIFSMNLNAATAQARFDTDPEGALKALTHLQSRATEAMNEMDALLYQLRPVPIEEVGLTNAIEQQCSVLSYRTGAKVACDIGQLPTHDKFEIGTQTHLYRIIQEALSNIARHARASKVSLSLQTKPSQDGEFLELSIADNGQGFDVDHVSKGMGLRNMMERCQKLNGRFDLQSTSQGTILQITDIPLILEPDSLPVVSVTAVNEYITTQTYRHRRFYILLFLLPLLVTVGWAFAAKRFLWLPQPSLDGSHLLILGAVLIGWLLLHLFESRQLLATIKLDALVDEQSRDQLQTYIFGQQALIFAFSGIVLTGFVYWLSRNIPEAWLYEQLLSRLMIFIAALFACLAIYQQSKYSGRQIEKVYSHLSGKSKNNTQFEPLTEDMTWTVLFLLSISFTLVLWIVIIFAHDTYIASLAEGVARLLQLLIFYAGIAGIILTIVNLLRQHKLRQWLIANLMSDSEPSLQINPVLVKGSLLLAGMFVFWFFTFTLFDLGVVQLVGPLNNWSHPITFWFTVVSLIGWSSLWLVACIRFFNLYRIHRRVSRRNE